MFEIREKEMNHIHFHTIRSDKFKTINIVVKCQAPLQRKTITKRALLPYILQQGTKNYPSEKALSSKLDELYGATFSIDGAKKGNNHIISFRLEVANEKFIQNETTVVAEALSLLKEIIFQPNLQENVFIESVVTREKKTLKNKINSIYDDKLAYANMRLIDEMCEGEAFSIHQYGYEEDLETIDAQTLYAYYEQLLAEDKINIYVLGDFPVEEMEKEVTNTFRREVYEPLQEVEEKIELVKKTKEIIDTQVVQQAKLHIGYRTNCTYRDEDYFALHLFNGLFGSFPSSKLFTNVREKHSLAYYASSRIESHKGLLFVFSGIEATNYKKAREIIEQQMQAMKAGDFTDKEIEETKELIISQVRETLDHPQGIIEFLYQQEVARTKLSPEYFIENIKKVTKQDIIRVANNMECDTVYLLTHEQVGEMDG